MDHTLSQAEIQSRFREQFKGKSNKKGIPMDLALAAAGVDLDKVNDKLIALAREENYVAPETLSLKIR